MTTADKIKMLRKQAGMTQTEFGALLGVQKNAVSKWECGRVEDIPASKIKAMAAIFKVKPSYLIDDDEPKLSSVEKQLLANFRKLCKPDQDAVMDIVARFVSTQKNSAVSDMETAL